MFIIVKLNIDLILRDNSVNVLLLVLLNIEKMKVKQMIIFLGKGKN